MAEGGVEVFVARLIPVRLILLLSRTEVALLQRLALGPQSAASVVSLGVIRVAVVVLLLVFLRRVRAAHDVNVAHST